MDTKTIIIVNNSLQRCGEGSWEHELRTPTIFRYVRVHSLHVAVVLEQLQHVAVRLPEELDPRREHDAVRPLLGPLTTDRAQEETGAGEGKVKGQRGAGCVFYSGTLVHVVK